MKEPPYVIQEMPSASVTLRTCNENFVTQDISISVTGPSVTECCDSIAWLKDLMQNKLIPIKS